MLSSPLNLNLLDQKLKKNYFLQRQINDANVTKKQHKIQQLNDSFEEGKEIMVKGGGKFEKEEERFRDDKRPTHRRGYGSNTTASTNSEEIELIDSESNISANLDDGLKLSSPVNANGGGGGAILKKSTSYVDSSSKLVCKQFHNQTSEYKSSINSSYYYYQQSPADNLI